MSYIQPERLDLLNFFKRLTNTQFVVPVYQRNYVWSAKKQVKKFLEDYSLILTGQKNKHFIGIMMYLQIQKGIGFSELSVVDGQQRLVTTFLILHSLKEICIETGDSSLADKINEIYLINKFVQEDNQKLKLKPLISDDNVYAKIISGKQSEITEEEKRTTVYQNYSFIKNYLKEKFGQFSLEKMLDALNGFYFVAIPLGTDDDTQEIFETINSTGYELTKSDLIRNYLLMNIESDKQEYLYTNFWYPLEKKFENSSKLEGFFRIFLANQTFVLPDMENIYDVFRNWYKAYSKNHSIEDVMKAILLYAKYYTELFISDKFNIEPHINKSLKEFRKNTVEPTAPLLMEIYHLYDSYDPSGERLVDYLTFSKIIDLFTVYNIRRNICNLRSGVLTRIIPPMLKDVLEACGSSYKNIFEYTVKFLVDNNKGKASFMPDDEYLRSNLIGMNAYALKNYLKTIFERIESYNNPAVVDFSNLSIEHLMPQTPTEEWLGALGITKDVYDANLHRIGNLTLATHPDNSKMSNKPWEYKKQILENTQHLKMNIEILEKEKWDIEEIDSRTKDMIEKIIALYPYVEGGTELSTRYDIFLNTETTKIKAVIYEDMSVEVLSGSVFDHLLTAEISDMLEVEALNNAGSGFVFATNYSFSSLAEATEFVLENNDISEWELWEDSKGDSLNMNIRTILINKKQSKNK